MSEAWMEAGRRLLGLDEWEVCDFQDDGVVGDVGGPCRKRRGHDGEHNPFERITPDSLRETFRLDEPVHTWKCAYTNRGLPCDCGKAVLCSEDEYDALARQFHESIAEGQTISETAKMLRILGSG